MDPVGFYPDPDLNFDKKPDDPEPTSEEKKKVGVYQDPESIFEKKKKRVWILP